MKGSQGSWGEGKNQEMKSSYRMMKREKAASQQKSLLGIFSLQIVTGMKGESRTKLSIGSLTYKLKAGKKVSLPYSLWGECLSE